MREKAPCIFLPDENAQGCLVERARRFREHRPDLRPWEINPCQSCKVGRDRAEAAGPPAAKESDPPKSQKPPGGIGRVWDGVAARWRDAKPAVEKPAGIIPKDIPDRIPGQGKEGSVDQEKVKENIVRVLGRKGPMAVSTLKNFAAAKESKEDFRAAVDALAGEGKIATKQGSREGSLTISLPGAPTPTEKTPKKKTASTPREPVAHNRKPAAPSNGSGAIAAAIAELEVRRTAALDQVAQIDASIAGLRALA